MISQNPKFAKDVLIKQIQQVEASLLTAYPNNGLKKQLETGTRYNGNGTVEAYLSFLPNGRANQESIGLTYSISCSQRGAVFASEIAWSDGKTIDEVLVCKMCPDCLDQLGEKVENLAEKNRDPLVERILDLLDNFNIH